jgi:NADH:ubiquinone reductase (H+-translocating)
MNKKNIFIIGCGFAGTSAVKSLSSYKNLCAVNVIDQATRASFLPLLPDVIGRNINPDALMMDIKSFCEKHHASYINEQVISIIPNTHEIITQTKTYHYDFLIIASGSKTTFYGDETLKKYAHILDSVEDAEKIRSMILTKKHKAYVVIGGGYTGFETATHTKKLLDTINYNAPVVVVERAPSVLGNLPPWMKKYAEQVALKHDITVYANTTCTSYSDTKITLSNGKIFDDPLIILTAGVVVDEFASIFGTEKMPQHRIPVDSFLKANDNIFAVGDTALFKNKESFLRMGVYYSITEGKISAKNIIRMIQKKSLLKYPIFEPGYIVPFAHNESCGLLFGKIPIKGKLGIVIHYLLAIYFTQGLYKKYQLIRSVLSRNVSI